MINGVIMFLISWFQECVTHTPWKGHTYLLQQCYHNSFHDIMYII